MLLRIHTTEPLQDEIRGTFELPVWPYKEGPGVTPVELMTYFRELNVFRYEDSYTGGPSGTYAYAIMVPNDEGVWPQDWEMPLECFEHVLWVDDDTCEILEWPNDNPQGFALHRKITEEVGDNFAWAQFNTQVGIRACSSQFIAYTHGHNKAGNVTNAQTIREASPASARRYVSRVDKATHQSQNQER